MDQQPFIIVGELLPEGGIGRTPVDNAIDKVRNDLNRPLNLKLLNGALFKVLGNGGNGVVQLNTEARNRNVRSIVADQGDIGAMQCRDEWNYAVRQHLL